MKALRLVAVTSLLILALTGCGSDQKTVMPDVVGKKLDVAKSEIKRAGFAEEVLVVGGGTFGVVVESNWQICDQSPEAGQGVTDTPRLTVDRSCSVGSSEPTAPPAEASDSRTEQPSELNDILTVKNNKDFAALLAVRDPGSDSVEEFAAKYSGRTIEFDGHIAAMNKHRDANTRYDILILAGDYSKSSARGPQFQFRDVNTTYDLHFTDSNPPETIGARVNLHIVAKVGNVLEVFDSDTELFFLTPVAIEVR